MVKAAFYTRDATSDPFETTNEYHGQDILHSLIYSKPLEESQALVSSNEKGHSRSIIDLGRSALPKAIRYLLLIIGVTPIIFFIFLERAAEGPV